MKSVQSIILSYNTQTSENVEFKLTILGKSHKTLPSMYLFSD
jgi:hypothetical protein